MPELDSKTEATSTELPHSAGASAPAEPAKFSAADGVPEWAVGRTAREVVDIAERLRSTVVSGAPAPAPSAPAAPASPAPANARDIDANLMYSDGVRYTDAVKAYTDARINDVAATVSAQFIAPLAATARDAAMRSPAHEDVWRRYGPEIDAMMATVHPQGRTDPAIWGQAAELVAGKHYRELARVEADRLIASGAGSLPTTGTTGAAPAGTSDPIDALFHDNHPAIEGFRRIGKSASDVRAFATSMGHSPEAYANMLKTRATRTHSVNDSRTGGRREVSF